MSRVRTFGHFLLNFVSGTTNDGDFILMGNNPSAHYAQWSLESIPEAPCYCYLKLRHSGKVMKVESESQDNMAGMVQWSNEGRSPQMVKPHTYRM